MLSILEFIFEDPIHYFGTLFFIFVLTVCINSVTQSFSTTYSPTVYNIKENKKEDKKDDKD